MKGRKTTDVFVSTEISVDGSSSPPLITPGKLKKDDDREAVAQKLRDKGFSYRRISETLQVPYILVSRWLNGDMRHAVGTAQQGWSDSAAEQVFKWLPRKERLQASSADSAAAGSDVEVLEAQFKSFEKYVRNLMTGFTKSQQESEARELRLAALVETQKAEAAKLEARLRAEIKELRATVEKLATGKPAAGEKTNDPVALPLPEKNDPFAETTADDPFADAAQEDDPFADAGQQDDPFADIAPVTEKPSLLDKMAFWKK